MKKNLLVVMGGNSPEHEISLITAVQAMRHIDKREYDLYPLLLLGEKFYYSTAFQSISTFAGKPRGRRAKKRRGREAVLSGTELFVKSKFCGGFRRLAAIDCALICTHGGSGEDGGLQGLLGIHGIPYTSPNVAASAVCMDKILSKRAFQAMGLPQIEYTVYAEPSNINKGAADGAWFPAGAWLPSCCPDEIERKLGYPVIVKPADLGSSIGINTAQNRAELQHALAVAAEFSGKIVVEKKLENFMEINCAAVLDGDSVILSALERPAGVEGTGGMLSFEDKYLGRQNREIPARIDGKLADRVRNMTKRIYTELGLSGIVRMDFLVDADGVLYVNEVNTVPGSMAFYLFEHVGISFKKLLSITIKTAILQHNEAKKYRRYYKSNVLEKFSAGTKIRGKQGRANKRVGTP